MSGRILGNGVVIANTEFVIDAPVKNWVATGWDATLETCVQSQGGCGPGGAAYGTPPANTSPRRYALRPQLSKYGKNPPLDAVKAVLNQFIFHHDGCADSQMCWQVLHNERGLSCHFLVDNDGTIYQTIDLAFMAYHAAVFNVPSIGVEISNRGEAAKNQDYYARQGKKRNVTTCTINGSKILTFDFTDAQLRSMTALCGALTRLLPNIPIEYPQSSPGQPAWGTLLENGQETGAFKFKGYLGHYHCTRRKWDPGPFDFKSFCEKLRGQRCFPLWTGKAEPRPGDRPYVPSNGTDAKAALDALYRMNEEKCEGGFFPIGPWGENRLWHGGVHLATKDKATIWSPFAGRVVAARMGRSSPYGSCNFVLVRHDMTVGAVSMRFFALYMHVHDELGERDPAQSPPWMKKDGWQRALHHDRLTGADLAAVWNDAAGVALLDEPVEAGEVLARVGRAGPDNTPQIHFEIFSESQVLEKLPGARLELHDGSGSSRFVDDPDLVKQLDADRDGKLSHREVVGFFAGPGARDQFRLVVAYFTSEWTAEPDCRASLAASADFRAVKPAELDAMVADQLTPTLWWNDEVAEHCKLRTDGLVYHYNPIDFIGFINEQIEEAAVDAPKVDTSAPITGPATDVTDDFGDKLGLSAVTQGQIEGTDPYQNLDLQGMVDGFETP